MAALCRACPGSRLRAGDLIRQTAESNVSSYVANALFFGNYTRAVTTLRKSDVTKISTTPLNTQKRRGTIGRAAPSSRLRASNLYKTNISDVAQFVGNDMFFGAPFTDFLEVLTPDHNQTVLVDPSTFVSILNVILLNPAVCTVLVDVASFVFVPFDLTVIGPKPFSAGGGSTANVGYGG